MKASTLIVFFLLVAISIFAQESQPEKENKEETPAEKVKEVPDKTELKKGEDEVFSDEEKERSNETKSFTLDAADAVLKEKVISEKEHVVKPEVPETTTYHHNSNNRNDDIQTLGGENSHHGGFGAVSFRASEFNSKDIVLIGFRGGWIINRAMAIGFEGYGIIPTAEYDNIDPNSLLTSIAVGGYGGMFIEPILYSNKVVHVTFPIAGGGGWLGYIVDWEQNQNIYSNDLIDDDVFWYVEPGAALELNVARNFRINMGATYRFSKDLELINTPSTGFDGWNYFLTLKFGSF